MSARIVCATPPRRTRKEEIMEVRTAASAKALLAAAARVRHTSMSEFNLSSAVREARNALADHRVFQVPDENWAAFMSILGAPVLPEADIVALARSPSPWGK
jgi:uncharacterized protein (DUF1778 family)